MALVLVITVAVVIGAVMFVGLLVGEPPADDGAGDEVGACIVLPDGGGTADIERRPCDQPHTAEVFRVATYPDRPTYPGEADWEAFFQDECLGTAFQAYTGQVFDQAADIEADYLVPTAGDWSAGDRELVCYLQPAGGGEISESLRSG